VDKFPKMTNYVVSSRGAYRSHRQGPAGVHTLGEGTTIMHEGFVNFNAGTEGPGMVEGRISAGVLVGQGLRPGRRLLHHWHAVGRRRYRHFSG